MTDFNNPTRPTPVEVGDDILTQPKNPLKSTAIWGLVVIIVARLASKYAPPDLQGPVVDAALEILSWGVGPLMVLYGRWTATRPLGIGGPVKATVK